MDRSDVIAQFVSLTNCNDAEAAFYLEAAHYDLDRAVAMFYGGCCLWLSSDIGHTLLRSATHVAACLHHQTC